MYGLGSQTSLVSYFSLFCGSSQISPSSKSAAQSKLLQPLFMSSVGTHPVPAAVPWISFLRGIRTSVISTFSV